jgi:hypothetical protein
MTKKTATTAAGLMATLALLTLAGCSKPGIAGKWNGTADVAGQKLSSTMEFKPDGTVTQDSKTPLGEVNATGTYQTSGENLTIHVDKITAMGKTVDAPPQMKDQTATFKVEGDTLSMTRNGQTVNFTRVKE